MSLASVLAPESPSGETKEATGAPPSLKSLSGNGLLAITDQGLISGSNFILAIVLARALRPNDYGVYALGFEVFLFFSVIYTSLILEPMSVFGASVFREHSRHYFGVLLRLHAVASVIMLVVLAGAACVTYVVEPTGSLAGALAALSVASPLILMYWVARRAFYMKLSVRGAAAGGAVYFGVSMAGLYGLDRLKWLSPFSAFLLMALGAVVACALMLRTLKSHQEDGDPSPTPNEVLHRHWAYGRWALASAVPGWFFSGAMYFPLLGFFGGLAETGKLKALLNLTSPVAQAFVAVSLVSLPYASHVYHREGAGSVNRLLWRLILLYAGGTLVYWILLLLFRAPVVHILYAGKYAVITGLLPWVALGSIFRIAASAQANVLRAMESTVLVCRVYSIVGVVALLVGVPAIWLYGIKGAVFTFAVSGILASLVACVTVLGRPAKTNAVAGVVPADQPSVVSPG